LILKIYEKMELRKHGAIAQRYNIDQRNLNINANIDANDQAKESEKPKSIEEIEKEIAQLRAETQKLDAVKKGALEDEKTTPKEVSKEEQPIEADYRDADE